MRDTHGMVLNSSYTVELISTVEGIAALENDWNRLIDCAENPNVFMTYGWFYAWTKELANENGRGRLQPYVLSIKQNEAVVGIAPLVLRIASRFGLQVRKLEFATHHSDYNELVVGRDVDALTSAAIEYLARSTRDWDLIELEELRDTGHLIAAIRSAAASSGLPCRFFLEADGCPYMPIDGPWAQTQKKKHLNFARRAFLGFSKRAGEGFRLRVAERPHTERDLLERIIAVEAQKQVGGDLSEPFFGRHPEIFQTLFDKLGPRGSIAIVLLEKCDELVAYLVLFACGEKLWHYQTAYHRTFSELSPGTLLMCAAVDYGFEHGCNEFDFLRGMERYKQRWTEEFRRNSRVVLWNRRWISRVAAMALLRQQARVSRQSGAST